MEDLGRKLFFHGISKAFGTGKNAIHISFVFLFLFCDGEKHCGKAKNIFF